MSLSNDIENLRAQCFKIEAHLPAFNAIQVSPMSDQQFIRHGLYLVRCEIDRIAERSKKLGVEYPAISNSFVTVEPE